MSRKSSPKTPEIYADLTLNDNKQKHLCLVVDTAGKTFKFQSPSHVHILKDAIREQYADWDAFYEANKDGERLKELHRALFKCDAPKSANTPIEVSIAVWHKMVASAEDRVGDSPKNPANAEKKSRKSLDTRVYIAVRQSDGTWPQLADLKTPQALVCLQILRETCEEKDGTLSTVESKLRLAVANRAAEIKTRQDPWRIFQYYRPSLVAAGVLKHD